MGNQQLKNTSGFKTGGAVSKKDLKYIRSRTNFSKEKIELWDEEFRRHCPEGVMTLDHFISTTKYLFRSGDPTRYCRHAFRTFDVDGSGYLDFREFMVAIDIMNTVDPHKKLSWLFSMCDGNNDGFISQDELEDVIQGTFELAGHSVSGDNVKQRASSLFKTLDTNADGQISKEEFISCCLKNPEVMNLLSPSSYSSLRVMQQSPDCFQETV